MSKTRYRVWGWSDEKRDYAPSLRVNENRQALREQAEREIKEIKWEIRAEQF